MRDLSLPVGSLGFGDDNVSEPDNTMKVHSHVNLIAVRARVCGAFRKFLQILNHGKDSKVPRRH